MLQYILELCQTLCFAQKLHYGNCIIARRIRSRIHVQKKPIQNLSTSRRWILPPLFPCREEAASVEDLSHCQSARRLGKDCSRCWGWGCEISLPPLLPFNLCHFRAGSPNTDRRLFQSALATPGTSFQCTSRAAPWFDCCLAEIRALGVFSGSARKAGPTDFHT